MKKVNGQVGFRFDLYSTFPVMFTDRRLLQVPGSLCYQYGSKLLTIMEAFVCLTA